MSQLTINLKQNIEWKKNIFKSILSGFMMFILSVVSYGLDPAPLIINFLVIFLFTFISCIIVDIWAFYYKLYKEQKKGKEGKS